MSDDEPIDDLQQLLAVCMAPNGVETRTDPLDGCIKLLAEIRAAVLAMQSGDMRALLAVRLVAQSASALLSGARTLLPHNVYAASALVRQLVEVEYLAWACGYDETETLDWITSNRETRGSGDRTRQNGGATTYASRPRFKIDIGTIHEIPGIVNRKELSRRCNQKFASSLAAPHS